MKDKLRYTEVLPTHGDHRPLWPKYGEYRYVCKVGKDVKSRGRGGIHYLCGRYILRPAHFWPPVTAQK